MTPTLHGQGNHKRLAKTSDCYLLDRPGYGWLPLSQDRMLKRRDGNAAWRSLQYHMYTYQKMENGLQLDGCEQNPVATAQAIRRDTPS